MHNFLRCQDPGSLVNCTLQYPVQCCAIYFYERFTRCDNSSPRSQINSGIFHVRNVYKNGRRERAVVYFTDIETEGNPSRITPTSSVRVEVVSFGRSSQAEQNSISSFVVRTQHAAFIVKNCPTCAGSRQRCLLACVVALRSPCTCLAVL